jgi:hypothetical protein
MATWTLTDSTKRTGNSFLSRRTSNAKEYHDLYTHMQQTLGHASLSSTALEESNETAQVLLA